MEGFVRERIYHSELTLEQRVERKTSFVGYCKRWCRAKTQPTNGGVGQKPYQKVAGPRKVPDVAIE